MDGRKGKVNGNKERMKKGMKKGKKEKETEGRK